MTTLMVVDESTTGGNSVKRPRPAFKWDWRRLGDVWLILRFQNICCLPGSLPIVYFRTCFIAIHSHAMHILRCYNRGFTRSGHASCRPRWRIAYATLLPIVL